MKKLIYLVLLLVIIQYKMEPQCKSGSLNALSANSNFLTGTVSLDFTSRYIDILDIFSVYNRFNSNELTGAHFCLHNYSSCYLKSVKLRIKIIGADNIVLVNQVYDTKTYMELKDTKHIVFALKKPKTVKYSLVHFPPRVNVEIISLDIDKNRTALYIKKVVDENNDLPLDKRYEYINFAKKLFPKINL